MRRINLSIPARIWGEIKRRAKADGISGAEWIRQAILMRIATERERERRRRDGGPERRRR